MSYKFQKLSLRYATQNILTIKVKYSSSILNCSFPAYFYSNGYKTVESFDSMNKIWFDLQSLDLISFRKAIKIIFNRLCLYPIQSIGYAKQGLTSAVQIQRAHESILIIADLINQYRRENCCTQGWGYTLSTHVMLMLGYLEGFCIINWCLGSTIHTV